MNSKLNNKLKNQAGKKNAFTIIEVVLVLAIAGLIFLIVFLALPGLQRSRRDTQRKSTFNNVAAALENAASNSGGKYLDNASGSTPGCNTVFVPVCPLDTFIPGFTPNKDPEGTVYNVIYFSGTNFAVGWITYVQGGYCDGDVATSHGTTPSHGGTDNGTGTAYGYALSMKLESGSICKKV